MKLDKILDFLFRTRIGHVALLGGLVAGAFMFSGCLCIDMIACACDPACDGCWSDCDDMCNSCFIDCGGDGCALTGCLFGDGCISDCGGCVIDCGGCNSTICTDCNVGCDDGYGNCGLSCFNCVISCGGDSYGGSSSSDGGCGGCSTPTHWKDITIYFYDQNGQQYTFADGATSTEHSYPEGEEPSQIPTFASDYGMYYEFEGYYLDREFTQPATDAEGKWTSKKDVEDVTELYGKLKERHYGETRLINFLVEPDTLDVSYASVSATIGGKISLPTPVSVGGYEFSHWRTETGRTIYDGEGTEDITFHLRDWVSEGGMDSAVVYVTAVYNPAQIEMIFNFGTDGTLEREFSYMTTLGEVTEILKNSESYYFNDSDKEFLGWSKNEDPGYNDERLPDSYTITRSETLYAIFRYNVTITLHYIDGPDHDMTQTVGPTPEGERLDLTGYRPQDRLPLGFDGWYYDSGYQNSAGYDYIYVSRSATNLYARWTKKTAYQIRYHYMTEDGEDETIPSNYDLQENQSYPLDPGKERIGYTFAGWCRQSDLGDEPIRELPAGTVGDQDLYAKYTPKTYYILMVLKDGEHAGGNTTQQVTYGQTYHLPVPTRDGYDFAGWQTVNNKTITNGEGDSLGAFTVENIGLTAIPDEYRLAVSAVWETHKFTVKFLGEDGSPIVTKKYEQGEQIGTPEGLTDPSKEGYDFTGWYDGGTRYEPDMQVQRDMTFRPRFTEHSYNVTLNANGGHFEGGQSTKDITIKFNEQKNLKQYTPTNDDPNKRFMGWSWDQDDINMMNMAAYSDGVLRVPFDGKHTTLYAIWM